ncbi:MAG: hypothetical protein IMW91_06880 [Firmicutes bacterium]|nr:hypothetical protein [Bacillota bacterium]
MARIKFFSTVRFPAVSVHPLFVLLVIFLCSVGLLGEAAVAVGALLWHESGHLVAGWLFRIRLRHIELLPFGAVAQTEPPLEERPAVERYVAFAGPLVSLLGAGLTLWIRGAPFWTGELAAFCVQAHLVLALLNLLPAWPLDGGRLREAKLLLQMDWENAQRRLLRQSFAVGGLLVAIAIALLITGTVLFPLLILGAFLIATAWAKQREMPYHTAVLSFQRRSILRSSTYPVQWIMVSPSTAVRTALRMRSPGYYLLIAVVDEGRFRGTLTEQQLVAAAQKGAETTVAQLL